MRSIAYHPQLVAAYHQVAGVCTFGDDIRLTAMIYTQKRDEIQWRNAPLMICTALCAVMIYQAYANPQSSTSSLRGTPTAAWIKKEATFGRQKLLLFWWGMVDSICISAIGQK